MGDAMSRPPLVGGGQGRSSREVRESASAVFWTLCAIGAVLACVIARGCAT